MFKEFRAFIARGNVVDLAVAVVMGAAFGSVVKSLVDDLIMPPIGLVLGRADFSNLFIVLKDGLKVGPPYASLAEAKAAGAVTMNYGAFVTNLVSFVIVAFAVFLLVKLANRLYTRPVVTADTKACPYCVAAIPMAASRCPQCTSQLASA